MTPNDGGAAFPHCAVDYATTEHGMSLQDWFAGMELTGLQQWDGLVNDPTNSAFALPDGIEKLAQLAYRVADAMLTQRGTP